MCPTETGDVPPCMVGTWTGSSDIVARFNYMMALMPENVFASMREPSGQWLFLRVEADGWFVTSGLHAEADLTILSDEEHVGNLRTAIQTMGGAGLFTAGPGDALSFCSMGGGDVVLTLSGEGDEGTVERVLPVTGSPFGDPMPMRQACAGDLLTLYVDLPPPMGTVTYTLNRIAPAHIPPEMERMLPER